MMSGLANAARARRCGGAVRPQTAQAGHPRKGSLDFNQEAICYQ